MQAAECRQPIRKVLVVVAFGAQVQCFDWNFTGKPIGVQPVLTPIVEEAATLDVRTKDQRDRFEQIFGKCCGKSEALCMIPADNGKGAPITFERFAIFIENFSQLNDAAVNPRYEFGELWLTRLNIMTRLSLRKLTFHHIDAQWSSYLGHFITPLLSAFFIITFL